MNDFARIMIQLSREEFIALKTIAEREYREPRQQARLIIRHVLLGESPPPNAQQKNTTSAKLETGYAGSPYEFNQLAGLVTAATALQRRARLRMSFGDIYPNIYGCIVARSSVYHKSSAIHKPRMILQRAMMEKLLFSELMTSEGLLKQLQSQPSGVNLRDEIGTLFDSNNTKYLRQLKPDLTALYDCYPYSRSLSQGDVKVEKPYLNILGPLPPHGFTIT